MLVEPRLRSASVDVTPHMPAIIGAGESPFVPADAAADTLEINALLLDGGPDWILLVSFDLLYVGPELQQFVESVFVEVPNRNIVTMASHTHRAPMVDETKPALGAFSREYLEQLKEGLIELRRRLLNTPSTAVSLRAGRHIGHHSINRRLRKRIAISRRPGFNRFVHGPNPRGVTDESIWTLRWVDDSNQTVAVLWNYACHPVGHPMRNQFSAHFAGFIRDDLRFRLGPVPVLFMQGFSGDTRPSATAKLHGWRRRVRRVITGPIFSDLTVDSYRSWAESLALSVRRAIDTGTLLEPVHPRACSVNWPSDHFVVGGKQDVQTRMVALAPNAALLGVGAEVVASFAEPARSLHGKYDYLLLGGCVGPTFGYCPTAQIITEGGYEAGGYCLAFGLEAVRPDIESQMMRALDPEGDE